MGEEVVKKLNPWLSIWVKPRETMRQGFGAAPGLIYFLFLIGVFSEGLDQAAMNFAGEESSWSAIWLTVLISMLIMYPLYYFVLAPLFAWLGRKLGGTGTTEKVRYALAYSYIPYVYGLVIVWIPSLLLFGKENFTEETPMLDGSLVLTGIYVLLQFISIVIAIWTVVISLKCLGEAHEFSAWKALATILIPTVAFLLVLLPLIIFAVLLGGDI